MNIRHVTNSFIPRLLGVGAITLYPFILYASHEPSAKLIAHEMVHVSQIEKVGVLRFYLSYLLFYFSERIAGKSHYDAYMSIPWEVEAYEWQK